MVIPKPPSLRLVVFAAALAAAPGCTLERRDEFLSHQYIVRDIDNTRAAQVRLEEEYLREQAHVDRLTDEVERLADREEALALEAADWEYMVSEAEFRLAELKEQKAAADAAVAAAEAEVAKAKAAAATTPPVPDDPAAIRARIEALLAEVDALTKRLAEGPGGAGEAQEPPAPPAPEEAAAPPVKEDGGG